MFRKLALALGASAVIGAAALTPTTASAHWHGQSWPLAQRRPPRRHRPRCAGDRHRFRMLRCEEGRRHAVRTASPPHHGLQLSEQTMHGK